MNYFDFRKVQDLDENVLAVMAFVIGSNEVDTMAFLQVDKMEDPSCQDDHIVDEIIDHSWDCTYSFITVDIGQDNFP